MARLATEKLLLLDEIAGWRDVSRSGLTAGPDGTLTLDPLPGAASLFYPDLLGDEFVCPAGLAVESASSLLVADARLNLVKRIRWHMPCGPKGESVVTDDALGGLHVETLPAIGLEGAEPRRLQGPRGVAVLPGGAIAVADTGNDRVQVFAPGVYALLKIWGTSDGPTALGRPYGLAVDRCGVVHIADRDGHRIQRIARDGTLLPAIGACELREPTRVTVSATGVVAVVDLGHDAVFLFTPERTLPQSLLGYQPRSATFGSDGRLFVGDAYGQVYVFKPSRNTSDFERVGFGVTGLDDPLLDLAWHAELGLVAIVREQQNGTVRQRLWRIDPAAGHVLSGWLTTKALDSGIERCAWHRIELQGRLPSAASVTVETYTSESKQTPPPETSAWPNGSLLTAGNDPLGPDRLNPDSLVLGDPGRYLWLRIRMRSNGLVSPSIQAIRVFFPRDSYAQYLPAVYREDEERRRFLERFLAIFQTEFDALEDQVENLWRLLDSATVPAEYLRWLAGWLALPPQPPAQEALLRRILKQAAAADRVRGTPKGLEDAVETYAGVQVQALEHFRLRRWPALAVAAPLDGSVPLWSRDFYRRLQLTSYSQIGYFQLTDTPEPILEPLHWGAHQFSVFFPANPYSEETTRQRVSAVVEREKPAHTDAILCAVYPRMRVGIQATVGVDSRVGDITYLILNRLGTLGYDSILGCSPAEGSLRSLGQTSRPRAGVSARLQ